MAHTRHVLVVDDDEATRSVIEYVVKRMYHPSRVSSVVDGHAAMTTYTQAGADVVITDVDMPLMDGLTLVRALRARSTITPIVVVSGNPDARSQALAAGATRFLAKPFSLRELRGVLNELIPIG